MAGETHFSNPSEDSQGAPQDAFPQIVTLAPIREPAQETLQEDSHQNPTAISQDEASGPVSEQLPPKQPTVSPWVEIPRNMTEQQQQEASFIKSEFLPASGLDLGLGQDATVAESESESESEEAEDPDPDFEGSDDESGSSDDDLQEINAEGRPTRPKATARRLDRIERSKRPSATNQRDEESRPQRSRRRDPQAVNIEISKEEKEISMELGLRKLLGRNDLTDRLYPVVGDANDATDEFQMDDEPALPADNSNENDWLDDVEGFLNQLSVIEGARKSASKPAIPSSAHKDQRKGLGEIARRAIAMNPTASRREVYKDSRSIQKATGLFTHRPHLDGEGHWKMDGMKSSLYHHQVQGIGWMRKRERSRDPIRGGMLCDVMGLGKTVTALATILDGRRDDFNKSRAPTLIIVPSQLVSNWKRQLTDHFDLFKFGVVQYYSKGMDVEFEENINGLTRIDVIIATYEDVRRSYPALKVPKDLEQPTKEAITAWWLANYNESVGLLHKVRWHRIVIDEGHTIRNQQSQISVAVRALTGGLVWILAGTPLHNRIEDLFPYFNFLKVPHSGTLEAFTDKYCEGGPPAKARLIATMRPFFKRRTYETTLFSLHIVTMHGLNEEDVIVDFCQAEVLLYDTLVRICRDKINELACCATAQQNCIWLMIIRLRLFSSHPLTAQVIVQHIYNRKDVFKSLRDLKEGESPVDLASAEIMRFFERVKGLPCGDATASMQTQQNEIAKRTSVGNRGRMTRNFRKNAKRSLEDENWQEYHERVDQKCIHCGEHLGPWIVLTQCAHFYCGYCFTTLPDQDGNDTGLPVCCKCRVPITEAVTLGTVDELQLDESLTPVSSPAPGAKRKGPRGAQPAKRGRTQRSQVSRIFSSSSSNFDDDGSDMSLTGEDDEIRDLIPLVGDLHLGATLLGSKLTKARDLIRSWIRADQDNKIVVFTHFLASLRLLEWMCQEEGLPYTKLSGQMPIPSRDYQIAKFQKDKEIKVMLATITTGGTGIDLTAANKCILLDLWWNLAVEEQANFRLFRLGQTRDVHCVKLIARGTLEALFTIDQQMLAMQHTKMANIQGVIGSQALSRPLEQVLQCLGHVQKTKNGGLRITKEPPTQSEAS